MNRYKFKIITLLFIFTTTTIAQNTEVVLVNRGKMNIKERIDANEISLYVTKGIRMKGDKVSVVLNGTASIGGSFFHDASTNVFKLNLMSGLAQPTTGSTGILRFSRDIGSERFISTSALSTFDRATTYLAMPNVEIATNDNIILPSRMGADALSIKRLAGKSGVLVLKSENIASNSIDASFRVMGQGSSADLVDIGAVIVERDVTLYRSSANTSFTFASPFKNTQLSGYFAGNWVRTPEIDNTTYHVRYPLANKPVSAGSPIIADDQYVKNPLQQLEASRPYLIIARPDSYNYQDMINSGGLSITNDDASAYQKGKFVFDGNVYALTPYNEQLFADDNLIDRTVTTIGSTYNWVIGNSYTAPLSMTDIANKMQASDISFAPTIYVFPAGSSSYVGVPINTASSPISFGSYTPTVIPAMSAFMIRISRSNASTGRSLSIGKTELVHSRVSHNVVAYALSHAPSDSLSTVVSDVQDQVVLRITPSDNPNIYDMVAIGLRDDASEGSDSYDIAKIYGADYAFQLYTVSSAGSKLSINGLPTDTRKVTMALRPAQKSDTYTIEAEYANTLSSEGLWLEDLKTNSIVDLKANSQYSFQSSRDDMENRFVVYFQRPYEQTTDLDIAQNKSILAVAYNSGLQLINLTDDDYNANIIITDMAGKLIARRHVSQTPICRLDNLKLSDGVYIVHLQGKRTVSVKAIVR